MAQPEKISTNLGKELIRRLQTGDYIRPYEELDYRRKIDKVGKVDVQDVQAWAFYFALMRNETEALKYFKKSLHIGVAPFIENYLAYLLRTSRVREFIKVALGLRAKYKGEKSIMGSVSLASIMSGNIEESRKDLEALVLLKSDESNDYQEYLKHFNSFVENAGFSENELKTLMDAYISIVEKHKLIAAGVVFESYPEFGINDVGLTICIPETEIDTIVNLDVELAFELGESPVLDGKVFSASFCFYEE